MGHGLALPVVAARASTRESGNSEDILKLIAKIHSYEILEDLVFVAARHPWIG